jgi:hypothetical protein
VYNLDNFRLLGVYPTWMLTVGCSLEAIRDYKQDLGSGPIALAWAGCLSLRKETGSQATFGRALAKKSAATIAQTRGASGLGRAVTWMCTWRSGRYEYLKF